MILLPLAMLIQAAPPPAPVPPALDRLPLATIVAEPVAVAIAGFDADGDGRVTRDELSAGIARSFAAADPSKNGSIGYIAFADWAERWLGDRNAVPSALEVDRDGDNRITLAELSARFDAIFTRLDRDKDGALSHAELLTIRASAARGEGDRDGRGRRDGRPPRR